MAVTILEALQNARENLKNVPKLPMLIGLVEAQMHNAVYLLEQGYPLETLVEPLLEEWGGKVEDVPEYMGEEGYV